MKYLLLILPLTPYLKAVEAMRPYYERAGDA